MDFGRFPILGDLDGAKEEVESMVATNKGKKLSRVIPNIGWWHNCFTLFERSHEWAGIRRGAEMAAYWESIAKTARAHPWELVLKYDEEFRRGAAGTRRSPGPRWIPRCISPTSFWQDWRLVASKAPVTERTGLRNNNKWGRGQWQGAVGGSGVLEYASGSIGMVVTRTGRRASLGMSVGCVQGDTQQAGARWLAGTGMVAAEVARQGMVARVAVALVSGQGVRWDPEQLARQKPTQLTRGVGKLVLCCSMICDIYCMVIIMLLYDIISWYW